MGKGGHDRGCTVVLPKDESGGGVTLPPFKSRQHDNPEYSERYFLKEYNAAG